MGSRLLVAALAGSAALGSDAEPPLATCGGSGGGAACMFPFTWKDTQYTACTTDDAKGIGLWCMTDDTGNKWGRCDCKAGFGDGAALPTCGGTAQGASCHFPFTYQGLQYESCTDTDLTALADGHIWCYTDAEFKLWGKCDCQQKAQRMVLAGVQDGSLPHAQKPSSAFTLVPRQAGQSSAGAGHLTPTDFSDSEVEHWVHYAHSGKYAHAKSRGWRLVTQLTIGQMEWCVKRIKITVAPHGEEMQLAGKNCQVFAPGDTILSDQFSPQNAFHDDASNGCSLRDTDSGLHYIGVRCDDGYQVQQISFLQSDPKRQAHHVRVQQLNSGRWLDVGLQETLPFNMSKVIYQSAFCMPNVCTGKYMLKPMEKMPKECSTQVCNQQECCNEKDICQSSTCEQPGWALKPGAERTRCATDKCEESFCCELKGVCMTSHCAGTKQALKHPAPTHCHGKECTPEECCQDPVCDGAVCNQMEGAVLKVALQLQARCVDYPCTINECCSIPGEDPEGQAMCEESVCAGNHVKWSDQAFGHKCLRSTCQAYECCTYLKPDDEATQIIVFKGLWSALPAGFLQAPPAFTASCAGLAALLGLALAVAVRGRLAGGADEAQQQLLHSPTE